MLRIKDWDKYFENSASRKLKRLDWVAVPNKMDGSGYTILVDHPNGAAHLGAWYAIVEIASKQLPRGNLPGGFCHCGDGICRCPGGICQCLGRMSRLPAGVFFEVLPRLIEIEWVESATTSAESATTSAESGSTGNGMEGNGIEGKNRNAHDMTSVADTAPSITTKSEVVKPLTRPPLSISDSNGNGIPTWKTDQHFVNFELDYLKLAQHFIDEDFEDAYENCWKRLALSEKLERIAGLNKHSAEYSEDPRFVPKPRKFLETEWKRPLKPKATKATTRAMTATEEARIVWEKTRGKRNRTRTGAD